jgi:hypothetical protein
MERVSAQQLQQWVAEARQRWNVPGIAVGDLRTPFTGDTDQDPSSRARAIGPREFEFVDEEWRGDRFDFPRNGFVNMVTLASRVR